MLINKVYFVEHKNLKVLQQVQIDNDIKACFSSKDDVSYCHHFVFVDNVNIILRLPPKLMETC